MDPMLKNKNVVRSTKRSPKSRPVKEKEVPKQAPKQEPTFDEKVRERNRAITKPKQENPFKGNIFMGSHPLQNWVSNAEQRVKKKKERQAT